MKAPFAIRVIPETNMVSVTCPHCGKTRQVTRSHVQTEMRFKRFDGTCAGCMSVKRAQKLFMSMKKVAELKTVKEVETACGIMVQSHMGGRCDPYDACRHYWSCLSEAAKLNWKGWRVCRNPQ